MSQMRSANKKHGNIGDVELLENGEIIEAWDAKYGKTYLRDELEELSDKLARHRHVLTVGFVTSGDVERLDELVPRLQDIEDVYHVRVEIVSFSAWVVRQFQRIVDDSCSEAELAGAWLTAYTASIAQKRRDVAPIDEPCAIWLQELHTLFVTTI